MCVRARRRGFRQIGQWIGNYLTRSFCRAVATTFKTVKGISKIWINHAFVGRFIDSIRKVLFLIERWIEKIKKKQSPLPPLFSYRLYRMIPLMFRPCWVA